MASPDFKYLSLQIEELFSQQKSDFEISKLIKTAFKSYISTLNELFELDSGKDFCVRHTRHLDEFIILLFKYVLRDSFGDYRPSMNALPVTLVALGSYGREQLGVFSDIDIMLVYKETKGYALKELLERILYLAWDAGLKLGHRVHEVEELRDVAKTDITIKTAILESRFIYGSKFLWTEIENELHAIRFSEREEFFHVKLREFWQRREQFPITMEPHLKEGVGGLRDANTLYWLGKMLYNIPSNKHLIGRLFYEEEYRSYRIAIDFLFRVRAALHLSAKKKEDRLRQQFHRDVALQLGFKDTSRTRAEVSMMAKVLESLQAVSLFCEHGVSSISRRPHMTCSSFVRLKKQGKYFWEDQHKLFISSHHSCPSKYDMLQAFNDLPDEAYRLDSSVGLAFLRLSLGKNTKKIKHELLSLFERHYGSCFWELFFKTGTILEVIPEFSSVINLAQYDGYHTHSVDIHTLHALQQLEKIEDEKVQRVFETLDKRHKKLLRLAIFFHDCGKGRRGDHCEVGAKLFGRFAKNYGISSEDVVIVQMLIRLHTSMSAVALKEDIHNEKTLYVFATKVQEQMILDMLYCLTYADMKAVAHGIYSPFSAELLAELYQKSTIALQNGELVGEAKLRLQKENALSRFESFSTLPKMLQKKIFSIRSTLFFLKHKPEEILSLSHRVLDVKQGMLSHRFYNEGRFKLELLAKQEVNLGWLLSKFSFLDVVEMDIFKLFDETKYFKIAFSESLTPEDIHSVEEWVALCGDMELKTGLKRPHILTDELSVDYNHSESLIKMNLSAKNQKGLMAFVIEIFDELGIDVSTAKIATLRGRANDLFLIEKEANTRHKMEKALELLTQHV